MERFRVPARCGPAAILGRRRPQSQPRGVGERAAVVGAGGAMLACAQMARSSARTPARQTVDVGFVLALTRDSQPGRDLERLGAVLERMGSAHVKVVVVDRSSVRSRFLRGLTRREGDSREAYDLELEIAATGLRRLYQLYAPNLLVVATEGLLDREDRELAALDRYALDFCKVTRRELAFFRTRTGLDRVLASMARRPQTLSRDALVLPIEGVRDEPLQAEALRRLWDEPDPAGLLDLRTVHRLAQAGLDPRSMSEELIGSLAGPPEARTARLEAAELKHSVDQADFPSEIVHGAPLPVRVRGWVSGVPPVRLVEVRAGLASATAPVAVHRPDVVAAIPGVREQVCGFDLDAELGPFAPGHYVLAFSATGTAIRETLGSFHVAERLEIAQLEVLTPAGPLEGGIVPLAVRGRVLATRPPRLELRVGERRLDGLSIVSAPGLRDGDPAVIDFRAVATLSGPQPSACVEARATSAPDLEATDRAAFDAAGAGHPILWQQRRVGAFDPARGGTPIDLEGVWFEAQAGDRLQLRIGDQVLSTFLPTPWIGADGPQRQPATFSLHTVLPGLGPGPTQLELVAEPGATRGRRRAAAPTQLDAWQESVLAVEPGFEVTSLDATPVDASDARLVLQGELQAATAIDALLLYVDGAVRARLGAEWLEAASPPEGPQAEHAYFRFDSIFPLADGQHEYEVRTRRGAAEASVWRASFEFARAAAGAQVRLLSPDLDARVRSGESPVWSRLALRGTVVGGVAGDRVELRLDGSPAASAALDGDARFELVAHPAGTEVQSAELAVVRGATVLARAPEFRIAPRSLVVPATAVGDLERLLDHLLPDGPAAVELASERTLRTLFERDPGAIGELRSSLSRLRRAVDAAEERPGEVIVDPPTVDAPPMRVLFAAWEPPCSLHGGGVAIRNTLRALSKRHEITLIHTAAPGEEGLSDEIRPWVRELLPVRREWRPPHLDPGIGVPPAFAWSYSPGYRTAIEGELATGRYELFNGDFLRTALHSNVAGLPSIGVSHEVESFAAAATLPERFDDPDTAAAWLGDFLRSLHFETLFAPERFAEYVTVTEPEARFLARLLPGRRIFVSPIPIDTDGFAAAAALRSPAPTPLFLFFGNFVHPPNREAARLLAEEIAPRVAGRHPGCRFVIAGANPPPSLVAREGLFGVHVPGFVPDLTELTSTCTAVVAPIFHGAGMRVKLLEAMAAGCPVVASPLGFSGIEAVAGEHWLRADDVDGFVEAAVRLAASPHTGAELGRAARRLVERVYGIEAQGERRERIWAAARRAFSGDASR